MNPTRVRYAPSPTGHLHIGGARTALFNYMYARSQGGAFIIRIEDTDLKRNVEQGEANQLQYLQWLGIDWDEGPDRGGSYGPYRQTERLGIYERYWRDLVNRGLAYPCYCTEEELEQEREEQAAKGDQPRYSGKHRNLSSEERTAYEAEGRLPSIRFRVPDDRIYSFDDAVRGTIQFHSSDIGDFVIVKKDGIPTYNFAVVVDDHEMAISHVFRGEEHISNTPRQLMLYEALGWEPPLFGHMTLIVNQERKKLSKRDESIIQFIEQYKDLGYLPEALFNFIALLGWSPEGEQEIFTREELIRIFDTSRLSKSPAMFDTDKLSWMNAHYMKHADLDRLVEMAAPYLQEAGRSPAALSDEDQAWLRGLVALYQEQLTCASDIVGLTSLFFEEELRFDEDARVVLAEEQVPAVLRSFLEQLRGSGSFTAESIKGMLKQVQKETGYKGKQLFMPVRAALTGQTHGRDLNETLALLGRSKVEARLESILS